MNSDKLGYDLLTYLGYKVTPIPTSKKMEADFLINFGGYSALVEAKLKKDSDVTTEEREKSYITGQPYVIEHKMGRNETLSGIVKTASKQLKSSSDKEHNFKFMLFVATGYVAEKQAEQFMDTIYGKTLIIEYGVENPVSTPCYFFRNSDFYRRKNIDAVIVGFKERESINFHLCLNPYSESYDLLKKSEFISPFAGYIIDPVEQEKDGEIYIPDRNIERSKNLPYDIFSNVNPMLKHLSEKYNLGRLVNIDFSSCFAEGVIKN